METCRENMRICKYANIETCRENMRAVLSSLVLLLGSAIALPSLLRTGQSDENVANGPAQEDAKWLHLCGFSPLCAFK